MKSSRRKRASEPPHHPSSSLLAWHQDPTTLCLWQFTLILLPGQSLDSGAWRSRGKAEEEVNGATVPWQQVQGCCILQDHLEIQAWLQGSATLNKNCYSSISTKLQTQTLPATVPWVGDHHQACLWRLQVCKEQGDHVGRRATLHGVHRGSSSCWSHREN